MDSKKLLKNSILRIEKSLDEANEIFDSGYVKDDYDDVKIMLINIMENLSDLKYLLTKKGYIT